MANAAIDANNVPTLIAASNADGSTPVRIKVDPTTHGVLVSDGSTGSDLSGDIAPRDANSVPCMMGVSSADGVTPVPIYADPTTGELLTKST